jgi:hypothetical protein
MALVQKGVIDVMDIKVSNIILEMMLYLVSRFV